MCHVTRKLLFSGSSVVTTAPTLLHGGGFDSNGAMSANLGFQL